MKQTAASVIATIRCTGAALGPKSYGVTDANLRDSARVVIAQRGLTSAIGGNELAGLKIRPNEVRNRLTLNLSAVPRAWPPHS